MERQPLNDMFVNNNISRRLMLKLGGAGLLGAGLVACGSPSTATSGSPTRGGTLQMAQVADIIPSGLFGQDFPNTSYGRLVLNTLTRYSPTLQPMPELATSWQMSTDQTTLTLQLRPDVKFHSGRPFGPADVIASIQNMQNPARASQMASTAKTIVDMSPSGANAVTLKLAHPISNLFDLFEMMFIIDQESLPELLAGTTVVGTGPFTWKSRTPGSSLTLARNPSYWVSGSPYLDGVMLRIIPQAQSLLSALQATQTQLAIGLAPKDFVSLRNNPAYTTTVFDTNDAVYYVGCNTTVPPFDNQMVRQAVAWSVDRDTILNEVFNKIGSSTSIPWAPSSPAYSKAAATHYTYDLSKAKTLLQQSGAGNMNAQIAYNSGLLASQAMAQIVQYSLTQVGINTTPVAFDAATYISKLAAGKLPGLFVNVHGFGQLQPATLVQSAFPFNAARNAENLSNPTYTQLANTAWTSTSKNDLTTAYQQLTNFMLDQQFVIDSVISPNTVVTASKFKDFSYNRFDYLDFDHAYLG